MSRLIDLAQEAYAALEEVARLSYHGAEEEGDRVGECGITSDADFDGVLCHLCLIVGSSAVTVQNLIDCLGPQLRTAGLPKPVSERWPVESSAGDTAGVVADKLTLVYQLLQAAHAVLVEATRLYGNIGADG